MLLKVVYMIYICILFTRGKEYITKWSKTCMSFVMDCWTDFYKKRS